MKLAICDNEKNDLLQIKKLILEYCKKNNYFFEIFTYQNYKELLQHIDNFNYIILDVLLDDLTGIQLAKEIHNINKDIKIIFCSINPEYSIEAFEVNAFRYLVKPINKLKLFEYLDEIRKNEKESLITLLDYQQKKCTINILDICYIDMNGHLSTIHLKNNFTLTIRKSMKDWILLLNEYCFYLTYKGILVNLKYVSSIEKDIVILKNGNYVYLSRKYRKRFEEKFMNMLGDTL